MHIFKRAFNILILFVESLNGKRIIIEIDHPENTIGYLSIHTISGHAVDIHCHRKHYKRVYINWFVPNKNYIAYIVFSKIESGAPDYLNKICEFELVIPALLPSSVNDYTQRRAAICAYLDMIMKKLSARNKK